MKAKVKWSWQFEGGREFVDRGQLAGPESKRREQRSNQTEERIGGGFWDFSMCLVCILVYILVF